MKYNLLKAFIHSIFPGTCEESWVPKNWCFWTVVLEKTLESPLDSKEIQPIHPKRDQSWVFIGRTDDEAETPILWPPHAKSWLIWKNPDAGRDWGQEEKGMTEDEMAGRTWVWVDSGCWWWTGRPGVLRFLGFQGVGRDWTTELNWTEVWLYTLLPYVFPLAWDSGKLLAKSSKGTLKRNESTWDYHSIVFLEQKALPCFKMCSNSINGFNIFSFFIKFLYLKWIATPRFGQNISD